MWHDHPFGQRNKKTERAVGLRVGGNRGGGQNLKKRGVVGGGPNNIGGLHKIGELGPLCQLRLWITYM